MSRTLDKREYLVIIRASSDKVGGSPIVITLSVHQSVRHDFVSAQ